MNTVLSLVAPGASLRRETEPSPFDPSGSQLHPEVVHGFEDSPLRGKAVHDAIELLAPDIEGSLLARGFRAEWMENGARVYTMSGAANHTDGQWAFFAPNGERVLSSFVGPLVEVIETDRFGQVSAHVFQRLP